MSLSAAHLLELLAGVYPVTGVRLGLDKRAGKSNIVQDILNALIAIVTHDHPDLSSQPVSEIMEF